ncbi:MAG: hypothetical protein KJ950_12600 [Proteobacteria bacterium]|nr:hypothetical protein [Pseudomonadota bacterium]MBU1686858.1 hypothetical protein [Pseudomonadota bacterium]
MKKLITMFAVLMLLISTTAQGKMYRSPDQIEPELIKEEVLAPSSSTVAVKKEKSGSNWWKWGLGLLAVGAIGAAAGGGGGGGSSSPAATADPTTGSGTVSW